MKVVKLNTKLSNEERETLLLYNYNTKKWTIDTTVAKHYNKAKKQNWVQLCEYVCDDGTVYGGVFEAPDQAVTLRNTTKKQLSDKQMENLSSIHKDLDL
jgi:hypothetical protein